MKTIKEWFSKLPKEHTEGLIIEIPNYEVDCMSEAIVNGLVWRKQPQGFHFWADYHSLHCWVEHKIEL